MHIYTHTHTLFNTRTHTNTHTFCRLMAEESEEEEDDESLDAQLADLDSGFSLADDSSEEESGPMASMLATM